MTINGENIVGTANLPGLVPEHASQMYASNLGNLIEHFWDKETSSFKLDLDDEILQGAVVTHGGEMVNERVRDAGKAG